jgi:hypothetical protein
VIYAKNDLFSGYLDESNLAFVWREATPQLLMKRSIPLY